MSNINIQVNGSNAGDGFLIAPDGSNTFPVPLTLSTNDGSIVKNATLDATPNGAGIVLPAGAISISPAGTTIQINATAISNARGDTVINVHVGGVTTSFALTGISAPEIWFSGRFEARFATDNDWYNDPKGTWGAVNDGTNPLGYGPGLPGAQGPGYTFWLEGEPLFTPTTNDVHGVPDSVPTTTDKTGVGRVVRFNKPVALRSHATPVITTVDGIRGMLKNSTSVYFTAGDPVIGAPVNLGPDTYLAQNWTAHSPPDPTPAESQTNGDTFEPMALFEFHIDGFFSGKPAADTDRPKSTGFASPRFDNPNSPIPTIAGIPDFMTFSKKRQADLQKDYDQLPATDKPTLTASSAIVAGTGTPEGRNLVRRIQHLSSATMKMPTFGGTAGRPASFAVAWDGQEEYENGRVNDSITISPNTSSVVSFLAGYTAFNCYNKLHTFHSDELCGYVHGSLTANSQARRVKTVSLQIKNSTFGKDELNSMGLPAFFPSAFWVVFDGFYPWELGIDAQGNLTNPANPPAISFTVDPPNDANMTIVTNLQNQMTIPAFAGPVLSASLPPANSPQRFLFPFNINFSGIDGFVLPVETLTLKATITVAGQAFSTSAPLVLTTSANPYVTDADAGNNYTSWLSTDLRVFTVDDDELFFGAQVSDYYSPPGSSGPVSAADASKAATTYIANVIKQLTPSGQAGSESFDVDLKETEDDARSRLEYLQINPRTHKPVFNFAICRVRIRGTTPMGPGTTQATNCRVFFRAFQAQNTVSTFNTGTTYRETPIVPNYGTRVPLPGVQSDSSGKAEYVTIPFFAVDRVNLAGPANLTAQPADAPNVQTISPITGQEVDTYFGCWLDMNQPTLLFPQYAPPDFDNQSGSFGKPGFAIQSINNAFTRAPHQCLIAEVAFDDVPIPPSADSGTSDKLAQRNLAWIDGPNPGLIVSRRMPHPFQIQATPATAVHVDELMITWGKTPVGSKASLYLPGLGATEILALANRLYGDHLLTVQDPYTIEVPTGPVTFVPIPKGTGLVAGLLTVDLPPGVVRGDRYAIVVMQVTDAVASTGGRGRGPANIRAIARNQPSRVLSWRRVLGAFQINIAISTKQQLLLPEEHRLALFRSIAANIDPQNRWYPVMQRYIGQLAGRVSGFGGNPADIPASPTGNVPGQRGGRHGHECSHREGASYHKVTGKVNGLIYDRFGDFEGFLLLTEDGHDRSFISREHEIEEIVGRAWAERIVITVLIDCGDPHRPASIILRRAPRLPELRSE